MRAARATGCVVLALAVGLPTAGPAQAVQIPQTTKTFGSVIDEAATWERESTCDPTEKKGPKTLRTLLTATYGPTYSNIVRACSRSDSGHEEGRALDWMVNVRVPEQKAMADSYLAWLSASDEFGNTSAMARRLGISYVIWNNQMWRPSSGTWTTYSDCDKRKKRFKKYDNTCHRNHVHTSFSWAGALGRTSYYTGYVACPASITVPWVPAILPASPQVVPVTPTRVFGSKVGAGLPMGRCRVGPNIRLDVPVLSSGVLPATGAAAVRLRVKVTGADARTELRAWTANTLPPATAALATEAKTPVTGEVTVPVAADGLVSLALSGGMAHVRVDVVGWSPALS